MEGLNMVSFNASNPSEGTEYYDIIIENEPLLTECKFTRFRLPVNGNALKMILENSQYKEMNTVVDFDKHNSVAKTIKLLRDKLKTEGLIEDEKVIAMLCTYLWNACVELEQDPDSTFFKNGKSGSKTNGGNGKAKSKSKSSKGQEEEPEQGQQGQQKPPEHSIIISFEQWQTKLIQKYNTLQTTVQQKMPHLWSSLEFDLSVKSILHIKDITLPFAGIVLGPPSSDKTIGIDLVKKTNDTYHTHNFTPPAFVSHSSAKTSEELESSDMLPKLKNKCFLTPELAPIFAAKDDDLRKYFAILTTVLDGHGFASDSGVHGHRGYDNEDMMFTWIGAAVDIPFKVHKLMTNLGPKLYFLRVPAQEKTQSDYLATLIDNDFNSRKAQIQKLVIDYLEWLECACPTTTMVKDDVFGSNLKKMPWISKDEQQSQTNENDEQTLVLRHIVKLGLLLRHLRGSVSTWHTDDTQGSGYGYSLATMEEPQRAMQQLTNLAKGHALLTGRNYLTREDLPLIIRVTLSTAPIERVTIFDILLNHSGVLTVNDITASLGVSEHTARKTMLELKVLGLVDMHEIDRIWSDNITRKMLQITLKDEFNWFLEDEFKRLREGFKPEDNRDYTEDDNNTNSSNNLLELENKAVEEKLPPSKGQVNTEINSSSQNQQKHENSIKSDQVHNRNLIKDDKTANRVDFDVDKNHDIQVLRGKISSTALPVDSSSEIPKDYDIINSAEVVIPQSIYRAYADTWKCHNCSVKGDKWFMLKHIEYCSHNKELR
jgi:predicted DNA-binding transcriptional regulator